MRSSGNQTPKSAELVRDPLHGSVSVLTMVGKHTVYQAEKTYSEAPTTAHMSNVLTLTLTPQGIKTVSL